MKSDSASRPRPTRTWNVGTAQSSATDTQADQNREGLRVLIVDDDKAILDLLEALLRSIGITHIAKASSGKEANLILSDPTLVTDCVICDCAMADGNGLQLLKEVRTGALRSISPNACFILLTGMTDQMTPILSSNLDVTAYIRKPITLSQLRAAIMTGYASRTSVEPGQYDGVALPNRWPTTVGSKGI